MLFIINSICNWIEQRKLFLNLVLLVHQDQPDRLGTMENQVHSSRIEFSLISKWHICIVTVFIFYFVFFHRYWSTWSSWWKRWTGKLCTQFRYALIYCIYLKIMVWNWSDCGFGDQSGTFFAGPPGPPGPIGPKGSQGRSKTHIVLLFPGDMWSLWIVKFNVVCSGDFGPQGFPGKNITFNYTYSI